LGVAALGLAEADVEVAEPVRAALHAAVAASDMGAVGDAAPLHNAFASFARDVQRWDPEPGRMLVAPTVNTAIEALLRQVIPPGSVVARSSPVYGPFRHLTGRAGHRELDVPLTETDRRWVLDLDALAAAFAAPDVAAYLLCNPQNPTGTVHSAADLARLSRLAAEHGVTVISDEIHAPLAHSAPFASYGAAAGTGWVVTSPSKAWNLTGASCAVAVATNARAFAAAGPAIATRLQWETSRLGLVASEAAYRDGRDWLAAFNALLRTTAQRVAGALSPAAPAPAAGYLAWVDARELGDAAAAVLLADARAQVIGGEQFGAAGRGHFRLNFAAHQEVLEPALQRVAAVLEARRAPG